MHAGKLVFAQLMEFSPWHTFRRLVAKHRGDFNVRSFSCLDQFLCMAFAQLTYRESLRDIKACLCAQPAKLYHLGIRGDVSCSALSNANEARDWHIYYEFAQAWIGIARWLYAKEPLGVDLNETVYALDSTTIDLCLSLFPWAEFRSTKAAVKLHTLLDLRGAIPTFIHISDGKLHDVNVLDLFTPEPGVFYCDGSRLFGSRSRIRRLCGSCRGDSSSRSPTAGEYPLYGGCRKGFDLTIPNPAILFEFARATLAALGPPNRRTAGAACKHAAGRQPCSKHDHAEGRADIQ